MDSNKNSFKEVLWDSTLSFKKGSNASPASLSTYTKSIFTARADNGMFTFSFREAEYCLAMRAFFINVSFSIAKLIAAELKEAAESIVFTSALLYVS